MTDPDTVMRFIPSHSVPHDHLARGPHRPVEVIKWAQQLLIGLGPDQESESNLVRLN